MNISNLSKGCFALALLISFMSFAQQQDFILGKLLDSKTKEPVVFANVRIKDRALGVITNDDGSFRIPLLYKEYGDTIEISSMGYETKEVSIWELVQGELNMIILDPVVIGLHEAVIRGKNKRKKLNAKQIIQRAIDAIPRNYQLTPFSKIGYYRDYQLKDGAYTNLNEALVKVFDKGFEVENHSNLQFLLYAYQANLDFKIDSFAAKPYDYQINDKYIPHAEFTQRKVPNDLVLLFNHDAIRNNNERTYSYVNTFVKDFIKGHDFLTYFLTNYGNQKIYKIKFEKNTVPFQVKGDIYIDADTCAIRKLDYAVYRQRADAKYPEKHSETEMDLLYEILVEYQKYKDRMYLKYISFHNQFKLIRPPEFYVKEVIVNPNTYEIKMVLNKPASNWLKLDKNDFRVYYKGYKLKVKKVVREGYVGDTYFLSFLRKRKQQRERLKQLVSKEKDMENDSFKISVPKLADADGNFLAQRKSELLDQFREFFTQKVIFIENVQVDTTLLVDKSIPLNRQKKPITSAKMNQDYWMNTPLKKTN